MNNYTLDDYYHEQIEWLEKQGTWSKVDECMLEEICKNKNLSLAEQIWLKSLKEK